MRQAVAYGLDRKAVVDNFYGGAAMGGEGVPAADALGLRGRRDRVHVRPGEGEGVAAEGGPDDPREVDFWYPTDVSRPYMPDPKRNFEAFAASLNKSGFKVVANGAVEPRLPRSRAREGTAARLNFLGQTGDYADAETSRHLLPGARSRSGASKQPGS